MDVHRKITQRKGLQLIAPNDLSVGAMGGPLCEEATAEGGSTCGGLSGGAAGRRRGARPAGHPGAARSAQTTRVSVLVTQGRAGADRR